MSLPKQTNHLILHWLGREVLVYCSRQARAFCLNPVCSQVFVLCDGQHTEEQIADRLRDFCEDPQARRAAVQESLLHLREHQLLVWEAPTLTRREFSLGATLLPVVLSVSAPQPAWAASNTCVTYQACQSLGLVCNPCDPNPGVTSNPDCTGVNQAFCMQQWSHTAGHTSCAQDAPRVPAIFSCEIENAAGALGHWNRSCQAALNWVEANQPASNYYCCHCP